MHVNDELYSCACMYLLRNANYTTTKHMQYSHCNSSNFTHSVECFNIKKVKNTLMYSLNKCLSSGISVHRAINTIKIIYQLGLVGRDC
jgi:hypothetical protein